MRRTPSQLRKNSGPQPPLGEFYWKPTRQVRFPSPIVSIRGRYRDDGVHCERGGITYFRDYVVPADPKTERQVEQRQCLGTSQSAWKDVPAAKRDAWTAYGRKYFAHEMSSSPGPNAFSKAQSCRRGWGGAMSFEAPVLPPPPVPLRLVEVAAPGAGMVAFLLEHTLDETAGYRVELRMTPATINGRKPQEPQFSRAGVTAAESFFPLAKSGAIYLLAQPRHQVAPGERFGLGARLITPEGIPGPELRVNLYRLESEEAPPTPGGRSRGSASQDFLQQPGTSNSSLPKPPTSTNARCGERRTSPFPQPGVPGNARLQPGSNPSWSRKLELRAVDPTFAPAGLMPGWSLAFPGTAKADPVNFPQYRACLRK